MRRTLPGTVIASGPEQANSCQHLVETLAGAEPHAELAVEITESCSKLFDALPDERSRQVAMLKLENYTANEIALRLGCTRKTVQRKLFLIRKTWLEAADKDSLCPNSEENGH